MATRNDDGREDRTTDSRRAIVDSKYIVELSKTYDFEGEKVSSIDFSAIEDITARDMIKINKMMISRNQVEILPESSMPYALAMAESCTKYPVEFYDNLKPRDAIKVKNFVVGFINGAELD